MWLCYVYFFYVYVCKQNWKIILHISYPFQTIKSSHYVSIKLPDWREIKAPDVFLNRVLPVRPSWLFYEHVKEQINTSIDQIHARLLVLSAAVGK